MSIDQQVAAAREWMASPRFTGIVRLYSARDVAEQQGTIVTDYTVARQAAEAFYARLRELFEQKKQITTFGPYSPGQAVAMKRAGIEGIYLGRLGDVREGLARRGPGAGPRQLPAQPGAERSGDAGARAAHRRQEPALRPLPHDARNSGRRHRSSTSGRSSSRTRTPATAATRTCAIWSGASSRSAFPATTSRTRSPVRRSAATRAARCWCRPTSRSSGSARHACNWTSCGCPASSSPAPTPSRPRSSRTAATSAITRSSSGATNTDLPSYKAGYVAILRQLHERRRGGRARPPAVRAVGRRAAGGGRVARRESA